MKQIIALGALVFLTGCGVLTGPLAVVGNDWESEVDLSDSEETATIKGETLNILTGHITCIAAYPARAKKLTINAGNVSVRAECHVVLEYSESADFNFDALPGHKYLINMRVPGNGAIDLIDITDGRKIIATTGSLRDPKKRPDLFIEIPETPVERIMLEPGDNVLVNRNTVGKYWCLEPYVLRDKPIKKAWVRKGESVLTCVAPDALVTMIEPGEEVVEVRASDSRYYECPKPYELVTKIGWHATFSCRLPEAEDQE
jgi:hypothetical protein